MEDNENYYWRFREVNSGDKDGVFWKSGRFEKAYVKSKKDGPKTKAKETEQ